MLSQIPSRTTPRSPPELYCQLTWERLRLVHGNHLEAVVRLARRLLERRQAARREAGLPGGEGKGGGAGLGKAGLPGVMMEREGAGLIRAGPSGGDREGGCSVGQSRAAGIKKEARRRR